jgi:photosystem II stability/assembly factor-like uncharacterized protein
MRIAIASVMMALILGLGHGPVLAQTGAGGLYSIHMFDALTGWALTSEESGNALLRTTDGGTNWRNVTPHIFYLGPANVDVLTSFFAWVGTFRTLDGGRTWRDVLAPGWVRSIDFINSRDGWLLSCQGANDANAVVGVYRSADGGDTWTRVASDKDGAAENSSLHFVCGGEPHITFLNAMVGWITRSDPAFAPDQSYLYATQDGGRTWRQQKLPLSPQLASSWGSGIMPPRFFTARDGILPVFYANLNPPSFAVVYVTHDGGRTWTYTTLISVTNKIKMWQVDSAGRAMWGMSFGDINHGWMADGIVLYATSDGGRQWTAIRLASFTNVRQLDFISERVGWAVRQVFPFLIKTLDGGHTWTPVTYTISQP